MNTDKERKITFHTLIKRNWKTHEEEPFFLVSDTISYILKLKKLDRHFDLKDSKFCLLQYGNIETNDAGDTVITGFFKSARHTFRPNLLDRTTGEERKSPKKITEGDIEKTHFSIKISTEVFLTLEVNGNGVTINNIINYLSHFCKLNLKAKNKKTGFTVVYTKIGRGDFLTAVKELRRAKITEIFFDKSLLGSAGLNYSDRTTNLKRQLVLTVTAEKMESLSETAIDVYNSFTGGGKGISKVRVYGQEDNGTKVVLDTSFMEKVDSLNVPINQETGEVMTQPILTGLKALLRDLN